MVGRGAWQGIEGMLKDRGKGSAVKGERVQAMLKPLVSIPTQGPLIYGFY